MSILYKTIKQGASESQIIEKSRFIAHAMPVSNKEEADAFVAEIKSRYKDATHNVPAMVIGDKSQVQWASDDGEPQGTSGAPIVQMLVQEGLTNLVIVVTRYFGGIKLGTGGLVRAYTSSAKLAVEAAGVCNVQEVLKLTCEIDYSFLSRFQKAAAETLSEGNQEGHVPEEQNGLTFILGNIEYGAKVRLEVITFAENEEKIKSFIGNITSGSGQILKAETTAEKV